MSSVSTVLPVSAVTTLRIHALRASISMHQCSARQASKGAKGERAPSAQELRHHDIRLNPVFAQGIAKGIGLATKGSSNATGAKGK